MIIESAVSSDVVGSAVDERGFYHIGGSVTKKHLGVLWGIVDPVFKVEFGHLFVNFTLDVGVWDRTGLKSCLHHSYHAQVFRQLYARTAKHL